MHPRLTGLLLLTALLGLVGTNGAGARPAGSPNACTVLKAAVRSEFPPAYLYVHFYPTRGARGQVFNCSASKGPFVDPWDPHGRKFTFGFLPPVAWGSAAAAHKFWLGEWNRSRGTKGKGVSVARLRGFGADDAFGIETTSQDPKPHTDTIIRWVKGGYEGGVEVSGPGQAGDLEDGQDLLRALMKGIPRS
jgi:hypothetical protein